MQLLRHLGLVSLATLLILYVPASALTPQEKMETCKFGAAHQKLAGAARKQFMSRCMADVGTRPKKVQQAK